MQSLRMMNDKTSLNHLRGAVYVGEAQYCLPATALDIELTRDKRAFLLRNQTTL